MLDGMPDPVNHRAWRSRSPLAKRILCTIAAAYADLLLEETPNASRTSEPSVTAYSASRVRRQGVAATFTKSIECFHLAFEESPVRMLTCTCPDGDKYRDGFDIVTSVVVSPRLVMFRSSRTSQLDVVVLNNIKRCLCGVTVTRDSDVTTRLDIDPNPVSYTYVTTSPNFPSSLAALVFRKSLSDACTLV